MKKILALAIVLLGLIAFSLPVYALTLEFNTPFLTKPAPGGSAPWAVATLTDKVGYVELKIESKMASLTNQFIGLMFFNIDPLLVPGSVNFVFQSGSSTGPQAFSIAKGVNTEKADGDGYYDFQMDFAQGSNNLNGTEVVVYNLTYSGAGTFNSNSFNFLSLPSGGEGNWTAAAHIQGLSFEPGSTWIGPGEGSTLVPEPVTMILLGLGLLGVGIAVRKRS